MRVKNHWAHNENILNSSKALATSDVLLEPSRGILKSRNHADVESTFIYSSPMDTVTGLDLTKQLLLLGQAPVFCRFLDEATLMEALNTHCKSKTFWLAVGANEVHYNYLKDWAIANPKARINISVDVAHGNMQHLHKLYRMYSNASWCRFLMSGTIATPEAAQELYNLGCTHIRVGIGPGSACTTRIVTGCGVPNLTAVYNIWSHFEKVQYRSPFIIADGGIRSSGDIIKYLAAGADSVMVGSLLSKTVESCGWVTSPYRYFTNALSGGLLYKNKIRYKRYRGQASKEFQMDRITSKPKHLEGIQGPIQYPQYTTQEFITSTKNAIASALSYLGLVSINQLNPKNVKFIKISQNALKESQPHLLIK